jgi:hypothetical protein
MDIVGPRLFVIDSVASTFSIEGKSIMKLRNTADSELYVHKVACNRHFSVPGNSVKVSHVGTRPMEGSIDLTIGGRQTFSVNLAADAGLLGAINDRSVNFSHIQKVDAIEVVYTTPQEDGLKFSLKQMLVRQKMSRYAEEFAIK